MSKPTPITFNIEVKFRWWLMPYLNTISMLHDFIVNYINMDATIDEAKANAVVEHGIYIVEPKNKRWWML